MTARRWGLGAAALTLVSIVGLTLWPSVGFGAGSGGSNGVVALAAPAPGATRTYYIAADEVEWDYAPTGSNRITGQPFEGDALTFVQNGPDRIGKVYRKAVYREYTDATFNRLKARTAADSHLGVL